MTARDVFLDPNYFVLRSVGVQVHGGDLHAVGVQANGGRV